MSPELLVSVQNAIEAGHAISGGADWIDVKQPSAGSLGRPSAPAIVEVVERVADRLPVSVALGELREQGLMGQVIGLPLAGVSRVKVGLSGCRSRGDWQAELTELVAALPSHLSLVAVLYADWTQCDAPSPLELLDIASRLSCSAVLVDTYDKESGGLFDWMDAIALTQLFSAAHDLGLTCVAAGSLTTLEFDKAISAGADVLAVRGAACEKHVRTGAISAQQVQLLRNFLSQRLAKIS